MKENAVTEDSGRNGLSEPFSYRFCKEPQGRPWRRNGAKYELNPGNEENVRRNLN